MPKTKPTKSPIPHIPCKKTLQQPTPGPSCSQWREDIFSKPSQQDEPPIPGASQASDSQLPSYENDLTCESEPEVVPTQSSEEPFASPATPCSFIIVNDMPVRTPLPLHSPHSRDEALQEFTNL
ncbi:hypothetical protein O181_038879 [Austropuccinia psidii MF-1]|uniref:Uncharacterized protein n=1 Tax=Austropuccinia psidii MF-1 TaxID=1389203 RepID=A0A9Q3HE01_9BASI|nr:hypothetical protein [Austropuccinia psidii MF-1]